MAAPHRRTFSRFGLCVLAVVFALLSANVVLRVEGATNALYEWARADNNDPTINNQLDDCSGLVVSPDGLYIYGITREESSLITLAYDKDQNTMAVIDLKSKGGPGIVGLDHANTIIMSPDGRHLYVTSPIENSVTHFKRDQDTGLLTPMGHWVDGVGAVQDLWGAASMQQTKDGSQLYVCGQTDAGIEIFNVGSDGELTVAGYIENDNNGGLHSPTALSVSHDGKYVYVVSPTQSYFTTLSRNPSTGLLTVVQRVLDTAKMWGLDAVTASVVSPDDKFVYVLSASGALTVFGRNDANPGALMTPVKRYLEGTDPVTGLVGGAGLAVSADGSTVYVAAISGKVTMLQTSSDGSLKQVGQTTTSQAAGVNKASRVAIMPDGGVIVGGWGLVSALETTPSPAGPIPPPNPPGTPLAPPKAPSVPKVPGAAPAPPAPKAPAPLAPPSVPRATKAPAVPTAPRAVGTGGSGASGSQEADSEEEGSVSGAVVEESDYEYLSSNAPYALPTAQIDPLPPTKRKASFPVGVVIGVAGGLFAFTVIAVLADKTALNNFCRRGKGNRNASDDVDSPYRGSMTESTPGTEFPEFDASVPVGSDVVIDGMSTGGLGLTPPLDTAAGTPAPPVVGDQNV